MFAGTRNKLLLFHMLSLRCDNYLPLSNTTPAVLQHILSTEREGHSGLNQLFVPLTAFWEGKNFAFIVKDMTSIQISH